MSTCITEQRDEPGILGFQAFYEENLVSVYRFVFTRMRNREEAEDLTSQIFLKALRYYDPDTALSVLVAGSSRLRTPPLLTTGIPTIEP